MYPILPKSYKNKYPFRIGATSYIYPDHIIPNIKLLGPYIDEIELLFFESEPESLPGPQEIEAIFQLAKEHNLTYNIHLPTDIYLGHQDLSVRNIGIEKISIILDLVSPLPCTTFTLHPEFHHKIILPDTINKWKEAVFTSMEAIIKNGLPGKMISIETLMYPFEWVEDIIKELDLSVCMDTGHLLLRNIDLAHFFNKHSSNITIIHLHGVKNGRDHMSLDRLSGIQKADIHNLLSCFSKIVSLEVFSYNDLLCSLQCLEKIMKIQ